MVELKPDLVQEFIDRLERHGYTKDYVDGALEGMSFVLEFYQSMVQLNKVKARLIKEENNVSAKVAN